MDKWDYCCCYVAQKYNNAIQMLARPFVQISSKGLKKQLNIKYGKAKCQRYDLIYKEDGKRKPLFIYIHGGGFICGAISLRRPFCYKIASEQDYFVANIDYRVAPQAHMHEQFQDVFDAISAVFDECDKYNFDISNVVIGGESAGAYFASYLAVMASHNELFDALDIDFKYREQFSVKSTLLINGVYEVKPVAKSKQLNVKSFVKGFANISREQYKNIDSIDDTLLNSTTYVDSSYPPSVIHKGDKDIFGFSTEAIVKLFDNLGVEYFLVSATGLSGNHGFTIAPINKEGKRCFDATFEKINEYVNR